MAEKLNTDQILEAVGNMSVLELSDLVKKIEEKFGVSAAAPVATVAASSAASAPAEEKAVEEKATFNVILANSGANKIAVIKAIREIVPTLGLKEAKDMVDSAPKPVVEGVGKETAEEARNKLTEAGASVELR